MCLRPTRRLQRLPWALYLHHLGVGHEAGVRAEPLAPARDPLLGLNQGVEGRPRVPARPVGDVRVHHGLDEIAGRAAYSVRKSFRSPCSAAKKAVEKKGLTGRGIGIGLGLR